MKTLRYPMYSVVPSDDFAAPGIIRAPRGTNPVNASASGKREMVPMSPNATPRVKHPKLNRESWATSYAQARTEPRMTRVKARGNRKRRAMRDKRGR